MGLRTTEWGCSETDGVPVELVESQWGRLSMGMLQGVVTLVTLIVLPMC